MDLVVIVYAGLEHVLGNSAERTAPVVRKIFKSGTGFDAVLGISFFRIIGVTTRVAKILFHF